MLTFGNETSSPGRVTLSVYLYMYIYIYIYMYIYIKNNIYKVNLKNYNSNSSERKWSYCLKKVLLVACKFYIFCMDNQRVSNSLFAIWRSKDSQIVLVLLVLNPIFLGLKTITIQYCDMQSVLDVFQKKFSAKIIQTCFGHECFS